MRSRWDGGAEWTDAGGEGITPGAGGVWEADDAEATSSGAPELTVAIASELVTQQLRAASWGIGRSGWFAPLEPGQATLTFTGPVEGSIGDAVMIHTGSGLLWQGALESVVESGDLNGIVAATVTAVDRLGQAAGATLPFGIGAAYADQAAAAALAAAGVVATVAVAPSVGAVLPVTLYQAGGKALEYLDTVEKSTNSALFLQPDGTFLLLVRDQLPTAGVAVTDLAGINSPSSWSRRLALGDLVNDWLVTNTLGTVILDTTDAVSVAAYGQRSFTFTDGIATVSTNPYPAGLVTAMAVPRWVLSEAAFPVSDYAQAALLMAPLDWLSRDGDQWQVLSVKHDVQPAREGMPKWLVTIAGDQTQAAIVAGTPPTPDPPPVVTLATQVITADQDAVVAKTSSGTFAGNGKGPELQVGYWSGFRYRTLLHFPISWPVGFQRVHSAKITGRTSGQVALAFGSKPKLYARRITEGWAEGAYGAGTNNVSVTNATVWPGPATTAAGQALKSITDAEATNVSVFITDIAQAWHDSGNDGVQLRSANEDSPANSTEFESGEGGQDWTLTLVCEVI